MSGISGEAVLRCAGCPTRYSKIDAATFHLFPTGLCLSCYREMQAAPGCFGRRYDKNECPEACPDRTVCPLFQSKEIDTMLELTQERRSALMAAVTARRRETVRLKNRRVALKALPFQKGSIIAEIFGLCLKGTTISEVTELCAALGVPHAEYIRRIRSGHGNGHEWEVVDDLDGLGGRAWKIRLLTGKRV